MAITMCTKAWQMHHMMQQLRLFLENAVVVADTINGASSDAQTARAQLRVQLLAAVTCAAAISNYSSCATAVLQLQHRQHQHRQCHQQRRQCQQQSYLCCLSANDKLA